MCRKCRKIIKTKEYQKNPYTFICKKKIKPITQKSLRKAIKKLHEEAALQQKMNDDMLNRITFGIKLSAQKPWNTNIDMTV